MGVSCTSVVSSDYFSEQLEVSLHDGVLAVDEDGVDHVISDVFEAALVGELLAVFLQALLAAAGDDILRLPAPRRLNSLIHRAR